MRSLSTLVAGLKWAMSVRTVGLGLLASLSLVTIVGCGMLRVDVQGEAMSPTLRDGESALATRRVDSVDRGDIIGFRYPQDESKSFLKRVIGLPGERVESAAGRISINSQLLSEPYVIEQNQSGDTWGPITIPDGHYFVMGDNRRNSSDSRHWGTVSRAAIWAKVLDR